jgi:DNA-binding NarL/FixJ family response regulator
LASNSRSGALVRSRRELTERERDILEGIAAGLSNTDIGARLYLSPKTVANNVTAILAKLDLDPSEPNSAVQRWAWRRSESSAGWWWS